MGNYIATTASEQEDMLAKIGVSSIDELYGMVPQQLLVDKLALPEGLSEIEVRAAMEDLAAKNTVFNIIFRGAGAYDHYIPAIVKQIAAKEEFVTAYTPYQAEISQGILQAIFEYQTMICELTGMDVANASAYDGASAAAEAATMCRDKKHNRVCIAATCHPDTIETVKTYCFAADCEFLIIDAVDGLTDAAALETIAEDTACLIVQQPNFYGLIEDAAALADKIHQKGGKLVLSCNPIALGLLSSPAEVGADIAVGEGQPLGLPLSFGGPYLGYMACKNSLMRSLPGRIVGETTDADEQRAFVLTLQAREQHIKREKALSSICSNQALCALTAAVYLAVVGSSGLREVAEQSAAKAHYLAARLCAIDGFELVYKGEFFNEFVATTPISAEKLLLELEKAGILGGYPLSNNTILWCATEKNSKADIDHLIALTERAVSQCD